MGCTSCGSTPGGCKNNGHCASGGCNRLNTFDWLSNVDMPDTYDFNIVEVSFKHGARKGFYYNPPYSKAITGDMVVVEAKSGGFDIGRVSLTGELVKLQMKKKRVREDNFFQTIVRKANERDLERLQEAREAERNTMVKARVIARNLGLDMKIGDTEYQGDKRKVTIYYTADGRVDFRELIRHYAKEFKVKIEMRQIGARQESARIGGLGSCGRELCCSTWLSGFKSVSTAAARYQNIAINQSKLSGQCGRLKCCLNYELDTYLDALKGFPKKADRIETKVGIAHLVKTDIFKGLMYYSYRDQPFSKFYQLPKERVHEIQAMNKRGEKPEELLDRDAMFAAYESGKSSEDEDKGFVDVTGVIELPPEEKKRRRRGGKKRNDRRNSKRDSDKYNKQGSSSRSSRNKSDKKKSGSNTPTGSSSKKQDKRPKNSKSDNQQKNKQNTNKPKSGNNGQPKSDNDSPKSNNKQGDAKKKRRYWGNKKKKS